jgi:hypothetical protein
MFNQFGAGVQKQYNALNEPIAEKTFSTGQIMQTYYEFEPRASVTWQWAADMSVKASYTRMAQYLHQLSNSTSGQPTDTWMPSSQLLKPTLADQFAFGYFQNFLDNSIEFSLEGYYKMLQNQYDYEDGTDITLNEDVEAYILEGLGRSYGLEFYLKKNQGRFTGWLSYTLSQTQNKIAEVNNGAWYSSRFDKTHDISLVGSFKITDSWSLAATWVYSTGNAVTFPSGKYEYSGQSIPYYTERNGYRMPSYHRLDFNLHWSGNPNRKFKSSWDISVYNAYNRHNAYSITFRESETTPGTTEAVRTSLFGIVPSITWNFEF